MKRKQLFALLVLLVPLTLALAGCEDATPVLAGTPTPAATATPLPDPFSAEITAVPEPTDALGSTIDGADHYWQYLSLGELRVYEYEDGTFLDGICVNAYPLPLDGEVNIVYTTVDGKISGIGKIGRTAIARDGIDLLQRTVHHVLVQRGVLEQRQAGGQGTAIAGAEAGNHVRRRHLDA